MSVQRLFIVFADIAACCVILEMGLSLQPPCKARPEQPLGWCHRQLFPNQKPYKPPVSIPTQAAGTAAATAGETQQQSAQQPRPLQEAAAQLPPGLAAGEEEAVQYLDLGPADILPPQNPAQMSSQHLHTTSSQHAHGMSGQQIPAPPGLSGDPRLQLQKQQQHASALPPTEMQGQSVPSDLRLKQQQQHEQHPSSGGKPSSAAEAQGSGVPSGDQLRQQQQQLQQQQQPVSLADPRLQQQGTAASSGNTAAAAQAPVVPLDPRRPQQAAASQAAATQLHSSSDQHAAAAPADPRTRPDPAPDRQSQPHLPRPITLLPPESSSHDEKSHYCSGLQGFTLQVLQPPASSEPGPIHVSEPGNHSRPITLQPPGHRASGAAQIAAQSNAGHQHARAIHGSANGSVPQRMRQAEAGQGGSGTGVGNAIKGDDVQREGMPKPITLQAPQAGQQFQAHTFEYRR